jgi:hypothetical protein
VANTNKLKKQQNEINWVANKITNLKMLQYMTHMQRAHLILKIYWGKSIVKFERLVLEDEIENTTNSFKKIGGY